MLLFASCMMPCTTSSISKCAKSLQQLLMIGNKRVGLSLLLDVEYKSSVRSIFNRKWRRGRLGAKGTKHELTEAGKYILREQWQVRGSGEMKDEQLKQLT